MTQEGLAHAAGLSTTFISLIENGHKAPTILVVWQLAETLGVTAARLVEEWGAENGKAEKPQRHRPFQRRGT
jgi:transcriptional regulator with XRE-family HTH domain